MTRECPLCRNNNYKWLDRGSKEGELVNTDATCLNAAFLPPIHVYECPKCGHIEQVREKTGD
jgi:hypothetical protein